MAQSDLPVPFTLKLNAGGTTPDPISAPQYYDGLLSRRLVLGLAILAPAYHVLTVSGPGSATLGMRIMGLEVRTFDGGRPSWLHALIQIVLFYVTMSVTGGLILLVVLFNRHRRTLHDILSHLVVLRRVPAGAASATPPRR